MHKTDDDTLQMALDKIVLIKPLLCIFRLLEALMPAAEKIITLRPRNFNTNGQEIYLLTSGYFWLNRSRDDLQISIAKAPHIFGLAELLIPVGNTTYVKFAAESEVFVVSGEKAKAIFNQHPVLWQDVASILAFHLHYSTWRDLHLVNTSAYDTIRGKLMEIDKWSEAMREKNTILNYIMSTTTLSRSTILRILKNLSEGEYIATRRGRLVKINNLPLRY